MFLKLDLQLNDIDTKLGIVMIFYEPNYDRKYYFVERKSVSKDILININYRRTLQGNKKKEIGMLIWTLPCFVLTKDVFKQQTSS